MSQFALFLALVWGAAWAAFLQWSRFGQFLAHQRTWITVVVGVGVDLLIAALLMPRSSWARLAITLAVSGLPIIFRSLWNEGAREWEIVHAENMERQTDGGPDAQQNSVGPV